jgi:TonB family protein
MPLTARENDVTPASRDTATGSSLGNSSTHEEATARQQAVALEVSVSVNGARAGEAGEKSGSFSVSTKTVLVFGQGAVIRLNERVAPGQMLRLVNEKTKKEVACLVVKSKNERTMNGYVELRFTEPIAGFWGMRFPGELAATPTPESRKGAEAEASKIPNVDASALEVEDFKTELKSDERSSNRAELLAPTSDPATEALKIQNSRLQEQLSSLLFTESAPSGQPAKVANAPQEKEFAGAASKLLEMSSAETSPTEIASKKESAPLAAPVKSTLPAGKPTLKVEEVKVPVWLEPLARNVAGPSTSSEAAKKETTSKSADREFESKEAMATPPKREASAPKAAPAVFGRTLLDSGATSVRASRGVNKPLLAAAIAAGVLVSAAGVTWYLRQSASPAENPVSASALPGNSSVASQPAATEPPVAQVQQQAQEQGSAVGTATGNSTSANETSRPSSDASVPVTPSTEVKAQPAVISERVPKAGPAIDVTAKGPAKPVPVADAQPEPSKPSLGTVRLAKPKVGRGSRAANGGVPEPELDGASDALLPSDGAIGGLVGESGGQPAAPVPVGGDVKIARMISSVPPTYPPMARTQRVSGDVRIDALIDANGKVSSMNVISGPSLLHQAAMEALRQWKYEPATLDGKPVAMHLTVTIQFRLQ